MPESQSTDIHARHWKRALEMSWESFCERNTPVGAVVVDPGGAVCAAARSRRHRGTPRPGELAGTRIAHAEVNALAQLPSGRSYAGHSLYATVEPCSLCMGAAMQTGVGQVHYAWADGYGGATAMVVDNPQIRRQRMSVSGPAVGGSARLAERVSGAIVLAHYQVDRDVDDHLTTEWRRTNPELFDFATSAEVIRAVCDARAADAPYAHVEALIHRLAG
jgi:tRNA(Arg) A34 adenosine deaminase TadA